MDTKTQIDRLTELTILHRAQLKKLSDQMPGLRDEIVAEFERRMDEAEPQFREELEAFAAAKTTEQVDAYAAKLKAQIDEIAASAERNIGEKVALLLAEKVAMRELVKRTSREVESTLKEVPSAVKRIVSLEAEAIRTETKEQLRTHFETPRAINPRGVWQRDEIYEKLDLVSSDGSSFIANERSRGVKPGMSKPEWTLIARRGSAGALPVTTLGEIVGVPTDGELLIGDNGNFVRANLTAGYGINIITGPGSIEIETAGFVIFEGTWNASTNTPALASGAGVAGHYYVVSTAGTTNLDGITDWQPGDWAIFNGTAWEKVDNSEIITSVNGQTGVVVLTKSDVGLGNVTNDAQLKIASNLSDLNNAATARTNLGLGTIATQDASNVSITGGSITGITDLAVADGGTGASTLTGYVKGTGTNPLTASATIPNTDITGLGTISTQDANNVAVTGGSINGTTVGATTASTGAFTTLFSSGDTQLNGTTIPASVTLVTTTRQISTSTGLQGGGDLSADRTLSLTDTGVVAGTYGSATVGTIFSTDAQGRLTGITPVTIAPNFSDVANKPTTLSGYGITDGVNTSLVGANNGIATLDSGGKLPTTQLPALAITDYLGDSANEAAMLAKVGQKGDWTTRTDLGTVWIITGNDPTLLADWTQLTYPTAPVTSVAGKTGAVTLDNTDISGLGGAATLNVGTTTGTVAAGDDSRFTDARTPTAHASTHQHGGSDEVATATAAANAIPKAGSGGTLAAGWLPAPTTTELGGVKRNTGSGGQFVSGIDTDGSLQYGSPTGSGDVVGPSSAVDGGVALFDTTSGKLLKDGGVLGGAAFLSVGTSAGTVAAGDDARFTDARTPTAHASTHTNGTDDIQDATATQKGLATAAQITKLDGIATGANVGITQLTGDVTAGPGGNSQAATLANTAVSAGSYGSATQVGTFTVDTKGRLTAASNTNIAIANTAVSGLGTMSTQDASNVAITGGSINGTVGATTPTTGVFTGLTVNDNSTLGSSNSDTVNFNARVASDINPSADDTYDLGGTGHEWRDLYIDGTANIDSLVADTADINGGTIDGTTIGGSTAAAGAFTTLSATSGRFTGASSPAANSLIADFSTTSRLIACGPNNSTQGELGIYTITADGSAASLPAVFSSTGLAVTGALSSTTGANFATSSGSVGIGTASPSGKLQVVANTASAGLEDGFSVSNAVDSNCFLQCSGSAATDKRAVIGPSTGTALAFQTSSTERLRIDSSGNVGIGTTSPNTLLHLEKNQNAFTGINIYNPNAGGSASSGIYMRNSSSGSAGGGGAYLNLDSGNVVRLLNQFGNPLIFGTNSAERMRIDGSGNVGIGTTSPRAKIAVFGTTGDPSLSGDTNNISLRTSAISVELAEGAYSGSPYAYWMQVKQSNNSGSAFPLALQPLGGNVGIGTASPAAKLHVLTATNGGIVVNDGTVNGIVYGSTTLTNSFAIGTTTNHPLIFGTNNTFPQMTLATSGNVGIGTASPAQALHVVGEIIATGNITAYYSDDRLKTKLGNIENALDKVSKLNGFYYEANETAQALGYKPVREVGLSAQQVEAVLPEVVAPAPIDNEYKTLHYERVIPLLVEAIKELKAEIELLKK